MGVCVSECVSVCVCVCVCVVCVRVCGRGGMAINRSHQEKGSMQRLALTSKASEQEHEDRNKESQSHRQQVLVDKGRDEDGGENGRKPVVEQLQEGKKGSTTSSTNTAFPTGSSAKFTSNTLSNRSKESDL